MFSIWFFGKKGNNIYLYYGVNEGLPEKYGVCVYDITTGESKKGISITSSDKYIFALSPNEDQIIVAHKKQCYVRSLTNPTFCNTLVGEVSVLSVDSNSSGTMALVTSQDTSAKIWNISKQQVNCIIASNVCAAIFSPDGNNFATVTTKNKIYVRNSNNGKIVNTLDGHRSQINTIVFNRDGSSILSASNDKSIVWDIVSGKMKMVIPGYGHLATFSQNCDKILAVSTENTAFNSKVLILDAKTGTKITSIVVEDIDFVNFAQFNSDGTKVIVIAKDYLSVWDVYSGKKEFSIGEKEKKKDEHLISIDFLSIITPDGIDMLPDHYEPAYYSLFYDMHPKS